MSDEEPLKFWKEPLDLRYRPETYPWYLIDRRGSIMPFSNAYQASIMRRIDSQGTPLVRLINYREETVWVETGLIFLDQWPKPKPLGSVEDLHAGFYNGDRTDFSISNLYYTTDENIEMAKSWVLSDETAIFFIKEVDGEASWGFRNVMTCAMTLGMDPMDVVKLRTGRLTYKGYDWGFGIYD